jgi:hypothetical protein
MKNLPGPEHPPKDPKTRRLADSAPLPPQDNRKGKDQPERGEGAMKARKHHRPAARGGLHP